MGFMKNKHTMNIYGAEVEHVPHVDYGKRLLPTAVPATENVATHLKLRRDARIVWTKNRIRIDCMKSTALNIRPVSLQLARERWRWGAWHWSG